MIKKHNLLIILGATAVGKTKLAVQLASKLNGEIISADSRQVYKGMDIGTGKDLSEYKYQGLDVPYHLIDIVNAGEKYHVNQFKDDFYKVFEAINSKKKLPILCGGTGMYVHSLLQRQDLTAIPINMELRNSLINVSKDLLLDKLDKYSKEFTKHADLSSTKRIIRAIEIAAYLSNNDFIPTQKAHLNPFVIGLYNDVEIRREKILKRLEDRLQNGLIEEVERLMSQGVSEEILIYYGLEYKFVVAYLNGELTKNELYDRLGIAICQFAKRQMTFFRKMEKDGVKINWINTTNKEDTLAISDKLIKECYEF